MKFSPSTVRAMKEYWFASLRPVWVRLDGDYCVITREGDLDYYGFPPLELGAQVTDSLDFMVGLEDGANIDLSVVLSPTGQPVGVHVFPDGQETNIFIVDAARDYEQQQVIHQKANEVELLLEKQQRLTAELERARDELQLANKALQETAALQNNFVARMSHEFRTPLTAILGYTSLLRERKQDLGGRHDNHLRIIERAGKYLLSLVENLLDHGRLEADELTLQHRPTRLAELFEDIQSMFGALVSDKGLDLKVQTEINQDLLVQADTTRLRQILINIIGNALKFTDSGEVLVWAAYQKGELVAEVRDTGKGMDERELNQVFMPYWKGSHVDNRGAGLGMTIVKRTLDMMDGAIQLESQPGAGTCVRLTVPLAKCKTSPDARHGGAASPGAPGFRILLIEDDEDIANLLAIYLESSGCKVTRRSDGRSGYKRMLEQVHDAVLLDLNLPGMSGLSVLREARAQGVNVPVIAMSASGLESDRAAALRSGADRYILKPVGKQELNAIVTGLVSADTM